MKNYSLKADGFVKTWLYSCQIKRLIINRRTKMKTKELSALHKIIAVISIIASLAVVVLAILQIWLSNFVLGKVSLGFQYFSIIPIHVLNCFWLGWSIYLEMCMRKDYRFLNIKSVRILVRALSKYLGNWNHISQRFIFRVKQ